MKQTEILEKIVCDPNVMVGKPVIRGTRLTVEYVLRLLSSGASFQEIRSEYPGLADDDIRACLLFAVQIVSEKAPFTPPERKAA